MSVGRLRSHVGGQAAMIWSLPFLLSHKQLAIKFIMAITTIAKNLKINAINIIDWDSADPAPPPRRSPPTPRSTQNT